jgi:hypothetical protein
VREIRMSNEAFAVICRSTVRYAQDFSSRCFDRRLSTVPKEPHEAPNCCKNEFGFQSIPTRCLSLIH